MGGQFCGETGKGMRIKEKCLRGFLKKLKGDTKGRDLGGKKGPGKQKGDEFPRF